MPVPASGLLLLGLGITQAISAKGAPVLRVDQVAAIYPSNDARTDEVVAQFTWAEHVVPTVVCRVRVALLFPLRNGNWIVRHL